MKKQKFIILSLLLTFSTLVSCNNVVSSVSSNLSTGSSSSSTSSESSVSSEENSSNTSTSEEKEVNPNGGQASFDVYFYNLGLGNYKVNYSINNDNYFSIANSSYFYDSYSNDGYAYLDGIGGKNVFELINNNGNFKVKPTIKFNSSTFEDERITILNDVNPLKGILNLDSGEFPTYDASKGVFVTSNKKNIITPFARLLNLVDTDLDKSTSMEFKIEADNSVTFNFLDKDSKIVRTGKISNVGNSKDADLDSFVSSYTLPENTLEESNLTLLTSPVLNAEIHDITYSNDKKSNEKVSRYFYNENAAYYQNVQGVSFFYQPNEDGSIFNYVLNGENKLVKDTRSTAPQSPYSKFTDLTSALSNFFASEATSFRQEDDGYFHYYGTRWNYLNGLFAIKPQYQRFDDIYAIVTKGVVNKLVFVGEKKDTLGEGSLSYRQTEVNLLASDENVPAIPKVEVKDDQTSEITQAFSKFDATKGYSYTDSNKVKRYYSNNLVLEFDPASNDKASTTGTGFYKKSDGLWNFSFDLEKKTVTPLGNPSTDEKDTIQSKFTAFSLLPEQFKISEDKKTILPKAPIVDIYNHIEIGETKASAEKGLLGDSFAFDYDASSKTITGASYHSVNGSSKGYDVIKITFGYEDSNFDQDMLTKLDQMTTVKNTSWTDEAGVSEKLTSYLTETGVKALPYLSDSTTDGGWQYEDYKDYGIDVLALLNTGLSGTDYLDRYATLIVNDTDFEDTGSTNFSTDDKVYYNQKADIYVSVAKGDGCIYVSTSEAILA